MVGVMHIRLSHTVRADSSPSTLPGMFSLPAKAPLFSAAGLLTLLFIAVGALVYRWLERWPWLDCAYAATGVLTTVGIVMPPRTFRGTQFTALLNVASMGVAGVCIGELFDSRRAWARHVLRVGGDAPAASSVGKQRKEALLLLALAVPPWLAAAAALCRLEGWSWGEGALFTLMCGTGLGMGDLEPKTGGGKVVLCFYLFYSMGTWFHLTHVLGLLLLGWARGWLRPHGKEASGEGAEEAEASR